MPTPRIPTTTMAVTTKATKGTKMTTTMGNIITKALQASNTTKVNAHDVAVMTLKKTQRLLATSQ